MGKLTDDLSQASPKPRWLLAIPQKSSHRGEKDHLPRMQGVIARAACSQCSMCTQLCPRNAMGLNVPSPKAMRDAGLGNDTLIGDVNGIFSCCDCGLCTFFACNFGLKPNQAMQKPSPAAKPGREAGQRSQVRAGRGLAIKRLPTNRLLCTGWISGSTTWTPPWGRPSSAML